MYQEIITTIDALAGVAALLLVVRVRTMLTALASHVGVRVTDAGAIVPITSTEAG